MANQSSTVSIVIVTWNCKDYALECLSSLKAQRGHISTEIIVVDNASTDGTPEMIRDQFPDIRLIRSDRNLGFARGNNVGIHLTRGKYVCLINPDVDVAADCIEKLVDYMECQPSIGLLGPKMLGPDGTVQRSTMRFPTLWNSLCRALAFDSLFKRSRAFGGLLMRDFRHDKVKEVDVLNGWFWVIRRQAMDEVGPLDERFFMYGEDIDWSRRFHQAGWRVVFYPGAEAVHYGGGSSSTAPVRMYVEVQRANFQYWKKHHGRAAMAGYFLVSCLHHVIRILGFALVYVLKQADRSQAGYNIRRSMASIRWLAAFGPARLR
jgi:GT2 family glycosyltransferase